MFKVFLVEDEKVVREGIRNNILWEQYGFHYTGDASDGELALPMIRKIQPDLLITDIKMPFMDGLSLIKLVRKELPRTKIVIISGYDDFSYAQQAIHLGVEQYLLKPIIKEKLVEMLNEMREKIQEEQYQQQYIENFKREAQEYENFSRRRFFEQIVTGGLSVPEICDTAKNLNIDIIAPFYNIVLFSLSSVEYDGSVPESYTESLAAVQNSVTKYFIDHPELIFFRWNITTYAVVVKGSEIDIERNTANCVENIKKRCDAAGRDVSWYIACGTPVSRLSAIPGCFAEASRILSYRYLCPDENILSEASIMNLRENNRSQIDANKREIDPEHVRKFLSSGTEKEIDDFMDQILQNVAEDFASYPMFCRYLAMTVYFAAIKYLDSIGCSLDSLWSPEYRPNDSVSTIDEARRYVHRVIKRTIELRDLESIKQQRDILRQATGFIDKNFSDASISLDRVAKEVNISPNYLSAIFSQEVGQTLIEYLTIKRIDEAKRMLRHTDKLLSEIASDVGYKDSRYFSFVFKKITGSTPSDYRKGAKQ
ncbi:MAG: response regulator [Clostridiaceae bacterium]|nr:response regulator [Clostridiaceae bacterium]